MTLVNHMACDRTAGVTMQLLTARPKSRGTVGLKSTNPFDLAKVRQWGMGMASDTSAMPPHQLHLAPRPRVSVAC